jgi:sulfur carrier protein
MDITVNGDLLSLQEGASAADLVNHLDLGGKRIAMEVNLEIIPRSLYHSHLLQTGDRIEIVHAIGGG